MESKSEPPGLAGGDSFVQVVPFQLHVSLSPPYSPSDNMPSPPKRSTVLVAASYAIGASLRGSGLVEGESFVQVVPFQLHVSPR